MASIEILMGPSLTRRSVEAFPLLPGLVVHKAPDAPGRDLYNVTHRVSGLAILTHVPEQHIPAAQRMLGDACWTCMPDDIFESEEYYSLIRTVLQIVRGRDVLRHVGDEDRRRCNPTPDWGFFPTVTTPLIHSEDRAGRGEVVVRYDELQQLVREGHRQGRTPAMLVQVGTREDVAVVPFDVFPRGFFTNLRLTLADATIRGYVVVTAPMAERAVRGYCTRVSFGKDRFVVLGYLPFLRLVKRGLS
jgi:hypothetical protein